VELLQLVLLESEGHWQGTVFNLKTEDQIGQLDNPPAGRRRPSDDGHHYNCQCCASLSVQHQGCTWTKIHNYDDIRTELVNLKVWSLQACRLRPTTRANLKSSKTSSDQRHAGMHKSNSVQGRPSQPGPVHRAIIGDVTLTHPFISL